MFSKAKCIHHKTFLDVQSMHRGVGFLKHYSYSITLWSAAPQTPFIQYYIVICRPSDPTVGRPQAKIRTRYGRSRGKKIHIDCTLYSISVIRRVWDSTLQLTCQVKYEKRRVKNQLTGASISVPLMRKFNYTKTYTLLCTGVQGFILNLNKFTRYLLNLKRM